MPELTNIADILPLRAEQLGDRPAIRCPGSKGPDGFARYGDVISYADLDRRSHLLALGFQAYGIGRGQRAVVMLKPSIDFFLVMFALFKAGAVPVLVDPGIARSALKQCLREAEPQAFIGIPLAQAAKLLLRWAPDVRLKVTAGRFACFGGTTLTAIEALGRSPPAPPGCRKACCTGTAISQRRCACCSRPSRSSPAASVCRPFRRSRCSIRRLD